MFTVCSPQSSSSFILSFVINTFQVVKVYTLWTLWKWIISVLVSGGGSYRKHTRNDAGGKKYCPHSNSVIIIHLSKICAKLALS